ncbi:ABC transporter substrate-binding protein [Sinorhizobium americanum]|uniref:Iron ABC transport system, solute-binding protein n=1 Tax=Sinorhizobium americanum TaxID=194963 RepID=A0A1L3LWI8_9HYPH|nr:ABC transporter substrate-binding protein [Sinorhizobium americanum]APG94431.1 iron ABC transport system, solute-binding protein [Sinorhizobium americanum]OAP44502.1 ABC transporter substrate-binding protein [Sinorhizobium americanum]
MRNLKKVVLALVAAVFAAAPAVAAEVTDVTGRKVEIELPAKRILLGEARQIHIAAVLRGEHVFDTIVGWRDDLIMKDPDSYEGYRERFPAIEKLPRFGYIPSGDFSLEAAIALKPDVLTLNLEAQEAVEESGFIDKAAAAGIAVVYLDFRVDPAKNSEKSIEILGQIFGAEARAKEFIDYRRAQIAVVTDRLAEAGAIARPKVFIERSPGITGDTACCRTFGPANFGEMVEKAGGHNIGSDVIAATFGDLNPEQLVVANPDHVIVTGSNWSAESDVNQFVSVGRGADLQAAQKRLKGLMERPAFATLKAVKAGTVHAVWHQFYGAPYEFVPILQFAKWFHPELFADIDPDRTFREFHEKFLPIAYRAGYFVSLSDGGE